MLSREVNPRCPRAPLESNCHLMIDHHWSVGPHRIENTHEPYRPNRYRPMWLSLHHHASAPVFGSRAICFTILLQNTDVPLYVLCQLWPDIFSSTPCLLALGSLLVRDDRYTHVPFQIAVTGCLAMHIGTRSEKGEVWLLCERGSRPVGSQLASGGISVSSFFTLLSCRYFHYT
jgi:hypothetical protein